MTMKRKCYSYLEIEINGQFVGFSTITYHYKDFTRDIISAELLLYPQVNRIQDIQIAKEWATYAEDFRSSSNPNQDKKLTEQLLSNAIINHKDYSISINNKRDVFYLDLNVNQNNYKCFLVHELYIVPNFKQVQVLSTNEIIRFEISKPDNEIENEVISHLM